MNPPCERQPWTNRNRLDGEGILQGTAARREAGSRRPSSAWRGIPAGNSTVPARLGALGAHVIDADRVGYGTPMRGGEAFTVAAAAFGPEAPDEGDLVRASG